MSSQGFGRRIEQALLDYQSDCIGRGLERPSYESIGQRIAEIEGRGHAYGPRTLSTWIQEKHEPMLITFDAMAKLFGHRDGSWLAFAIPEARVHRFQMITGELMHNYNRPLTPADLADLDARAPAVALPTPKPRKVKKNGGRRKRA